MWHLAAFELRHAARGLIKRPAASLGAVIVMAVGVGLTSAIFAIADPFLLRPLPYAEPEHLAFIRIGRKSRDVAGQPPTLAAWSARADLFESVAAFGGTTKIVTAAAEGARAFRAGTVSPEFLPLLYGAGRHVAPAPSGSPARLMVTESMARALAPDGDSVIGRGLVSETSQAFEIAGILPTHFVFPQRTSLVDAVAVQPFPGLYWRNGDRWTVPVRVLARLRQGITPERLGAALTADPVNVDVEIEEVRILQEYMTAGERPLAMGALAAGLLIALVCVANTMNLQVARGVYRAQEFATRRALGASRTALARLVILELALIGVFAVSAALFLTQLVLLAVVRLMPDVYGALGDVRVTGRVVVFAATLGAAMAGLCAPVAWLSAQRAMAAVALRAQQDAPRAVRAWRFALVAGQVGIATGLLTGAALLVQSHLNLWRQDTGYSPEVRLMTVAYPRERTQADLAEVTPTTGAALRRVAGVTRVAVGLQVGNLIDTYGIAGVSAVSANGRLARVVPSFVSAGFFDIIGTRVLIGHEFTNADRYGDVVVLNQVTVGRLWPGASLHEVVGQSVRLDGQTPRVVGVVQDAFDRALDTPPTVRVYAPIRWDRIAARKVTYAIRASSATAMPDGALRRAAASIDPDAIVERLDSPTDRLAETVRDRTFAVVVLGIFSSACLGVTTAGIFAVVAFVAARRTREVAIHLALGAEPRHVRRLLVKATVLATMAGIATGALASGWIARVLSSRLYGVAPEDPRALIVAVVVLLTLAALAVVGPLRRAVRLDPTIALRAG